MVAEKAKVEFFRGPSKASKEEPLLLSNACWSSTKSIPMFIMLPIHRRRRVMMTHPHHLMREGGDDDSNSGRDCNDENFLTIMMIMKMTLWLQK